MSFNRHLFMLKYGPEKDHDKHIRGAVFHIEHDPSMDIDDVQSLANSLSIHHSKGVVKLATKLDDLADQWRDE
jgi:hypothetical protein